MSITNELRKWTQDWGWLDADNADEVEDKLIAIAYRIDKEHKAAVDKAHADGERNGLQQARSASEDWKRGFDEGFASADDWLADHEDAMVEHGWIKLPVDADGVPIRVGDEVKEVGYNVNGSVYELRMDDGSWWVFVNGVGRRPEKYRHYHAPTTEDVLRELADEVYADAANKIRDRDYICSKYAKRLQLREDK